MAEACIITTNAVCTDSGFGQSLSQKSWWPPACHSRSANHLANSVLTLWLIEYAILSQHSVKVRTKTIVPSRWRSMLAAWRSWQPTCGSPSTTFSTRGSSSYGFSRPSWFSSEYSSGSSLASVAETWIVEIFSWTEICVCVVLLHPFLCIFCSWLSSCFSLF